MKPLFSIGIAGGSGSGKTTVAKELLRRVGPSMVAELTQDRYYHDLSAWDQERRARHNFDHPDAVDEELFVAHLKLLQGGQPAPVPVYDFARHVREPRVEILEPRPVLLVEGILVLALPTVRDLMDVKVFVDTPSDLRFIRRLHRDMEERGRSLDGVVEQYLGTVRPMHLEFVEPSKREADVIIPEGGYNTVALELMISHIEHLVNRDR